MSNNQKAVKKNRPTVKTSFRLRYCVIYQKFSSFFSGLRPKAQGLRRKAQGLRRKAQGLRRKAQGLRRKA
jgi:hypothetical protein